MIDKICYIVGACGFKEDIRPRDCDLVIAADGGYKLLCDKGIRVDIAMGDFDSLGYVPEHDNVTVHPAEKDDTDMRLALDRGYELGYRHFLIFGGIGGRLDHTLANMQSILGMRRKGASAYLIGDGMFIAAIENESFSFCGDETGYLSLFPGDGGVSGVYLEGLKYTLCDAELVSDRALAVSNEFIDQKAVVRVDNGVLYLVWYGEFCADRGVIYEDNRRNI